MAYQVKRNKIYEEELHLVGENGEIIHTIHVLLDVDHMVRKLSEKHIALIHAFQSIQQLQATSEETELIKGLDIIGNAVRDILEAVFGTEDTDTIFEFYENRYVEMCQEVVPFITEIVIPQVRKMSQKNTKAVLSKYRK